MAEQVKQNEEGVNQAQKPARRGRGIATATGTQRLKFSHEFAKPNGLFIGHLDSVNVSKINISESSTGMPTFNGMEIPRLSLVFASNEPEVNKRRYVTLSFTAVESTVDTIDGGKNAWQVDRIFNYMKHLLDVYVLKGREFTVEETDALSLAFDDTDENGAYNPVDVETVIAAYTTLFENFAAMMNTGKDGKPVYLQKDGNFIPVWIKLIRYIKNKKGWAAVNNGDLSFPTFVGEGVIEVWKANTNPSIRIDIIKECITPKEEVKAARTPNVPGVGGVPVMGGVPGGIGVMGNDLAAEAAEEQPF